MYVILQDVYKYCNITVHIQMFTVLDIYTFLFIFHFILAPTKYVLRKLPIVRRVDKNVWSSGWIIICYTDLYTHQILFLPRIQTFRIVVLGICGPCLTIGCLSVLCHFN